MTPDEPLKKFEETALERWVVSFLDHVRWDEDALLKVGEESFPEQLMAFIISYGDERVRVTLIKAKHGKFKGLCSDCACTWYESDMFCPVRLLDILQPKPEEGI